MARGAGKGRTRTTGWLAAVLALLALLSQSATPSAAMAAHAAGVQQVDICSGGRADVIYLDRHGNPTSPPLSGLPCEGCLAAVTAALAAPLLAASPVEHAAIVEFTPGDDIAFRPAPRAPPRPPSQAPPHLAS